MCNQITVRLCIQLQLLNHAELAFALGAALLLISGLGRILTHQIPGGEGLKFDRIRTGLGGGINQLPGNLDATVMVNTCLGYDKNAVMHTVFIQPVKPGSLFACAGRRA